MPLPASPLLLAVYIQRVRGAQLLPPTGLGNVQLRVRVHAGSTNVCAMVLIVFTRQWHDDDMATT